MGWRPQGSAAGRHGCGQAGAGLGARRGTVRLDGARDGASWGSSGPRRAGSGPGSASEGGRFLPTTDRYRRDAMVFIGLPGGGGRGGRTGQSRAPARPSRIL